MPFQLTNVSAVSKGLTVPYAIAQLPDGSLLVTQRDLFILTHIDTQGVHHDMQIPNMGLSGTDGGLLGVCVDPAYHVNRTIYLAMTTSYGTDLTADGNQVYQCLFDQVNNVVSLGALMTTWGSGASGNGGIIKIGPDGKLFILAGCGGVSGNAQNLSSNNGKILRINLDGSIPADNPFGTLVWSSGHNVPTGICWQGSYCWAMEQGASGNDRINLIVPGQNYGYPITTTPSVPVLDGHANLTIAPALLSGGNETFNPGGIAATPSTLFWGAMGTPYPVATNWIGNSTMQGEVAGTPGTLPSGWVQANSSGLPANVVGTGLENGIIFIDLSIVGTASAGVTNIQFCGATTIAAAAGQVWTMSNYGKLAGGTLSHISSVTMILLENSSVGAGLASTNTNITLTSADLSTQRPTVTRTLTNGSTAFVQPMWSVTMTSGAVNCTLRIGAPQLETGLIAHPWVPTGLPSGTPCIGSTLATGTSLSRRVVNYPNVFGRIRDVIAGQDGSLYFCTSNCDSVGGLPLGLDFIYRVAAP